MNVETITMPKKQARQKLEAYRKALKHEGDNMYKTAAHGYAALAEGHAIIDLNEAVRNGGFDLDLRPKLAIARADRAEVRFTWLPRTTECVFDCLAPSIRDEWSGGMYLSLRRTVELGRVHGRDNPCNCRKQDYCYHLNRREGVTICGFAMVPMIPPDVRKKVKGLNLRKHFILWEIESWADESSLKVPPKDPYLLRHLGGALYAILAAWDLTAIERAVMKQEHIHTG